MSNMSRPRTRIYCQRTDDRSVHDYQHVCTATRAGSATPIFLDGDEGALIEATNAMTLIDKSCEVRRPCDSYRDHAGCKSRSSDCASDTSQLIDRFHKSSYRSVSIPDMFSSIMSPIPKLNPLCDDLKSKVDRWIVDLLEHDPDTAKRISKADFCYLASTWAPQVDEESLRNLLNWIHWGFLFDDQFDEGRFSNDLDGARVEIDEMLSILNDAVAPGLTMIRDPVRYIFIDTWSKIRTRSSTAFQSHWRDTHRHYFEGLLAQVAVQVNGNALTQSVDEYMAVRRGTVGVLPAIATTEFALGIDLPPHILSHPSVSECMSIATDLALLANDVLSYRKDLALGVEHNLITLLTKQGCSVQEAMDRIGGMLDDCYRRWYAALANLPVLGEKMDRSILRVIKTCRDVALGNLHWSFKTARYLGADGAQLKQTRVLKFGDAI